MVDYLLSKGADPTRWSYYEPTFMACVRTQSAEAVQRLLKDERCMEMLNQEYPHDEPPFGETILRAACSREPSDEAEGARVVQVQTP